MLDELIHNLKTQDNLITANPIFIVQQKRLIVGMDSEYSDMFMWVEVGEERVHEHTAKRLDRYYARTGNVPRGYARVGYVETWEFVTACLTRKGCEDYIKINGHNLNEPRIYVEGGFRNKEWEFIRNYFMTLNPTP